MKDDELKRHVDSLLRSRARALELSRRTERTRAPIIKGWRESRLSAGGRAARNSELVERNRELLERLKVVARRFSGLAEL